MAKSDQQQIDKGRGPKSARRTIWLLVLLIILLACYAGWQFLISKAEKAVASELGRNFQMVPPPDVKITAWPTVIFTRKVTRIEVSAENAVSRGLAVEDLKITLHGAKIDLGGSSRKPGIQSASSGTFSVLISEDSLQHVLPAGTQIDLTQDKIVARIALLPGYPIELAPNVTDQTVGVLPGNNVSEDARRILGSVTSIENSFDLGKGLTAHIRSAQVDEGSLEVSGTIRSNE